MFCYCLKLLNLVDLCFYSTVHVCLFFKVCTVIFLFIYFDYYILLCDHCEKKKIHRLNALEYCFALQTVKPCSFEITAWRALTFIHNSGELSSRKIIACHNNQPMLVKKKSTVGQDWKLENEEHTCKIDSDSKYFDHLVHPVPEELSMLLGMTKFIWYRKL